MSEGTRMREPWNDEVERAPCESSQSLMGTRRHSSRSRPLRPAAACPAVWGRESWARSAATSQAAAFASAATPAAPGGAAATAQIPCAAAETPARRSTTLRVARDATRAYLCRSSLAASRLHASTSRARRFFFDFCFCARTLLRGLRCSNSPRMVKTWGENLGRKATATCSNREAGLRHCRMEVVLWVSQVQ